MRIYDWHRIDYADPGLFQHKQAAKSKFGRGIFPTTAIRGCIDGTAATASWKILDLSPDSAALFGLSVLSDEAVVEDWAEARKRGKVWYLLLRGEDVGGGALMNGPSPVSEVRGRAHKGARIDIAWEGGELSFHLISSGAKHRHPLGSIPVACDPDAPARFVAQVWKKGDALQLLDLSASAMAPSPRQGYHPDPHRPFLERFRPEVVCSLTPSAACAVPAASAGDRPPLRLSPRTPRTPRAPRAPRAPLAARLSPGQSATPRLRAGPPTPAASAASLDKRRWYRRA